MNSMPTRNPHSTHSLDPGVAYSGAPPPARSTAFSLGLAAGLQLAVALTTSVTQAALMLLGFFPTHISGLASLMIVAVGIPFHLGGWTVRFAFESLIDPLEWLVGNRSATVQPRLYFPLLAIQVLVVTILLTRWFKQGKSLRDREMAGASIVLLINAFLNLSWPWWGS